MRSGIGPAGHLREHGIEVARRPAGRRREPRRSSGRRPRHRLAGHGHGRTDPPLDRDLPKRAAPSDGGARPDVLGERSGRRRARLLRRSDPAQAALARHRPTPLGGSDGAAADHAAGASTTPPTSSDWPRATGSAWSSRTDRRSGASPRDRTDGARPRPRSCAPGCSRTPTRSRTSSARAGWGRHRTTATWSTPCGRVHGVDGLHVVDASIIPDAPSGFPHLITIMLAEHLSARLLAG